MSLRHQVSGHHSLNNHLKANKSSSNIPSAVSSSVPSSNSWRRSSAVFSSARPTGRGSSTCCRYADTSPASSPSKNPAPAGSTGSVKRSPASIGSSSKSLSPRRRPLVAPPSPSGCAALRRVRHKTHSHTRTTKLSQDAASSEVIYLIITKDTHILYIRQIRLKRATVYVCVRIYIICLMIVPAFPCN